MHEIGVWFLDRGLIETTLCLFDLVHKDKLLCVNYYDWQIIFIIIELLF